MNTKSILSGLARLIMAMMIITGLCLPVQAGMAQAVFRVVTDKEGARGTAFLLEIPVSFFNKRTFIVTAAHVISPFNPALDDVFIEIGNKYNEETLELALSKVVGLLKAKQVSLPDHVTKDASEICDVLDLKETLCLKYNCGNLTAECLNAGLSITPLKMKAVSSWTEQEKASLRRYNIMLLAEIFPQVVTVRPRLRIRNHRVLSHQDDLAILNVEHDDILARRKGYLVANEADIHLGTGVTSYHFGRFDPLIKDHLLHGRGHICAIPNNTDVFLAYLQPLNSGSSGAPLSLSDDESRAVGIVLSKITDASQLSTGIYKVLNIARIKQLIGEYIEWESRGQKKAK